ncbi:hypothetical protein [Sulfuracidifex tepidarius]|uniref:Uncharacterized protein n=1 Tax=Sulfuracidifex tepidarius TaxID=1294262 RepID=A0A510E198_9CREN|nr:hypothetical protein [Sulfuracidifex tepidarius]BBG23521.1 hypothetical protein IC006_0805 [Sulfuracidifex tepidarius]BBG26275.1 hypothetical protein IC007_0780 [Sulfuracidifex tepidarius]
MRNFTLKCEESYYKIVPPLRVALVDKLVEKGMSVTKASRVAGISVVTYEKNKKKFEKEVALLKGNEEMNEMLEITSAKYMNKVDEGPFCVMCSVARLVLKLDKCEKVNR